jgi:O-antigen ligase
MSYKEKYNKAFFVIYASFLFVLPLYEAPKNALFGILILSVISCWLNNKCRQTFEIKIDKLDAVLFLMLASAILSALVNWPLNEGFKGVRDVLFFSLLGIISNHINFNTKQITTIAFVIMLSCIAGVLISFYQITVGAERFVTLHSVGSYPSSSMYFASCVFIAVGLYFTNNSTSKIRMIAALLGGIIFIALLLSGSRGGSLGFIVAVLVLLLATFRFHNVKLKNILIGVLFLSIIVSVVFYSGKMNPRFVKNTQEAIEQLESGKFNKNDGVRLENWRLAITVFQNSESKVFGIGPQEFAWIDREAIEYIPLFWEDFNSDWELTHAHNQFFDKLVEEGLLGLSALLLFYIYGGYLIMSMRHNRVVVGWTWYAALGSLVVVFVAGSFNQPFSNEVATLVIVLVALLNTRMRTIESDREMIAKNL